ncbi:hypothetical protein [Kribbella sp. NBC_00889]|uniref:hypothetical protein n=1 Tax=Kribbella sp. NBC_00889 TaxID=2975974 RepID=UPI00386463D0|nr:hypothetical protein OG817_39215 [Kribbella sp. NBC_00889]
MPMCVITEEIANTNVLTTARTVAPSVTSWRKLSSPANSGVLSKSQWNKLRPNAATRGAATKTRKSSTAGLMNR